MSRPAPPALTVRYDGSARTFAAGNDVVIGRDLRADVRIAHPLISRAHLVLRFDQGRWIAIDNGSLNGMYVNGRRVPTVDIQDGQHINIGNPDGPQLTFEVGRQQAAGRPPTTSIPVTGRPSGTWPSQQPHTQQPPISRPQPYPTGAAGLPVDPAAALPERPAAQLHRLAAHNPPGASAVSQQAAQPPVPTGAGVGDGDRPDGRTALERGQPRDEHAEDPAARPSRRRSAPGSIKIGRNTDNDIVIPDVLASRHHATLVPTAARHRDPRQPQHQRHVRQRIARRESALLHEGDTVTIGNVDLVFRGGTLVRRTETTAASGTGGLDVHGVTWTIEGNKTLLNNISLTARPGTLTAVIGPSGAGKSTFARLVAGYTHPTRAPSPSRATTSTPSTRRCAPGSGWCPRTTWCTAS